MCWGKWHVVFTGPWIINDIKEQAVLIHHHSQKKNNCHFSLGALPGQGELVACRLGGFFICFVFFSWLLFVTCYRQQSMSKTGFLYLWAPWIFRKVKQARLSPLPFIGHTCSRATCPWSIAAQKGGDGLPEFLFYYLQTRMWSVLQSVLCLNIQLLKPWGCSEGYLFSFPCVLPEVTLFSSFGLLWICRLQSETVGVRSWVWTTFCCGIHTFDVQIHWGIMSSARW